MIFSTLVFNITLSETSFTLVPNIGDETPDFELPDIDMKIHTHKLSQYVGKEIVLAFFPAAESAICTKATCSFRDALDESTTEPR